jgi:hypothetical protein
VVLFLASPGGWIEEGEQVIRVLRMIRRTHTLETAVLHGKTCPSLSVPICLQGQRRFAARASLWVFHEAATPLSEDGSKWQVDPEATVRLIKRYYIPAGVSVAWLSKMLSQIDGAHDYWQTGHELITAESGIITDALTSTTARSEAQSQPHPRRPRARS